MTVAGMGGPQSGGPQFIAAGNAADAMNCVPPVESRTNVQPVAGQIVQSATAQMAAREDTRPPCANADAMNCVPPERKHPSKNSVHEQGFRSTILFVTVCAEGRNSILANGEMLKIILNAWANAQNWLVGRYVIMPDHIHFFCAPATYPAPDFHRWMKQWKSLVTIAWRKLGGPQSGGPQFIAAGNAADAMNCVPPKRLPSLFQRNCWDTQMRTGAQYEEKWQYVRNNPVRKGLSETADDWPYQGVVHDLPWHD